MDAYIMMNIHLVNHPEMTKIINIHELPNGRSDLEHAQ